MNITWNKALVAIVALLVGVVGYFLKNQFDKLDVVYRGSLTVPEDVKKIKEIEIPKISKRLDDQQGVLVALVSGTGRSMPPEFKKLLQDLVKSLRAELDKTSAMVATLQDASLPVSQGVTRLAEDQARLDQAIARLVSETERLSEKVALSASKEEILAFKSQIEQVSELLEKHQKVAAVAWLAPYLWRGVKVAKEGEVLDLRSSAPTSYIVKSPARLYELSKDFEASLGEAGLELNQTMPPKAP